MKSTRSRHSRSFAIIPAAGHSRRMGRPKLLMPFGSTTVLQRVLAAWRASPVSEIVVVARRDDAGVLQACERAGVHAVTPRENPAEMKISVRHGLRFVQTRFTPGLQDVWLLAPADYPRLSPPVIAALLSSFEPQDPTIVVPCYGGRRGHPVLFPWSLAGEVATLGADQGINALLDRHPLRALPCDDETVLDDLDTPEDYERLTQP